MFVLYVESVIEYIWNDVIWVFWKIGECVLMMFGVFDLEMQWLYDVDGEFEMVFNEDGFWEYYVDSGNLSMMYRLIGNMIWVSVVIFDFFNILLVVMVEKFDLLK